MVKHKKLITLYCGIICFVLVEVLVVAVFLMPNTPSVFNYSITNDLMGDMFFFLIGWVIAPLIGVVLGYRFAPLLLWIHKKTKGSRGEYYIYEKMELKEFKFTFQNLFFPALMALNLAMVLANIESVQQLLLTSEALSIAEGTVTLTIYLMPPLVIITGTISTALFSVSSFLLDTGIVFVNKEKMEQNLESIKIFPVGQGYMSILKGYAGISVVISLISLVYNMATGYFSVMNLFGAVMWALMPFLLSFILIPMMILIDKFHHKGRLFVLKHAKKLDITKSFEELSLYLNKENKRKDSTETILI